MAAWNSNRCSSTSDAIEYECPYCDYRAGTERAIRNHITNATGGRHTRRHGYHPGTMVERLENGEPAGEVAVTNTDAIEPNRHRGDCSVEGAFEALEKDEQFSEVDSGRATSNGDGDEPASPTVSTTSAGGEAQSNGLSPSEARDRLQILRELHESGKIESSVGAEMLRDIVGRVRTH